MALIQLLILQFVAHLLADFSFQTEEKAKDKNKLGFKSKFLKWHFLFAFLFSWILSFQVNFFAGALSIAVLHYIIDGFKYKLNNNHKFGKYSFFIDQILHLLIITAVVLIYHKFYGIKFLVNIPNIKYLVIFTAYLFCIKPANILIKEIFRAFEIKILDQKITEKSELPNAGKLIGIVERWLVLTFIIINQFQAVGFLIAAKSILRFRESETSKTEYVLIGTMLSFGIAIFLGILINFGVGK